MASSSELLRHVRQADPDRYFCTLFAPSDMREPLCLLYAFNHELARAREVASEPTLALIRLTWWREVVDGAHRRHELAEPLGQALAAGVLARDDLAGLIDAREAEARVIADYADFMRYVQGSAGNLMRIAAKILGAESEAAMALGTAYGIAGVIRAAPFLAKKGRSLLPQDGTPVETLLDKAREMLRATPPRASLAACLPAVYARRDVARYESGRIYAPRGLADRLAVLHAALRGRI